MPYLKRIRSITDEKRWQQKARCSPKGHEKEAMVDQKSSASMLSFPFNKVNVFSDVHKAKKIRVQVTAVTRKHDF